MSESAEIAIKTEDLTKIYKRRSGSPTVALDGLNLIISAGLIVGFIGPNGAGKSTTIKILTGLVRPDRGQALVFGRPSWDPEGRRRLGYLPETANYHEFMRVGELLREHALLYGLSGDELTRRCSEALDRVGLADRIDSKLKELSKGMRQRFGIAQALLGAPDLLILDEPTSGLDPLAQKEIKDIILGLRESGATIFFSSHQLTDVELICDLIGIIHKGKLLKFAPLDELLEVGKSYRVAVKGGGDELLIKLEKSGAMFEKSKEGGVVVVAADKLDSALRSVYDSGATVESVEMTKLSLEEVFFNLIKGS